MPLTSALAKTPIIGPDGLVVLPWLILFRTQDQAIAHAPSRVTTVTVAATNAAISTTPLPADPLAAGLYQVSYYARIVTAAVTSSSLTVTLAWSDGAATCTASGAAITGNTTTTTGTGFFLLRVDATSPISYSTTYASNGAGEMSYELELVLQAIET